MKTYGILALSPCELNIAVVCNMSGATCGALLKGGKGSNNKYSWKNVTNIAMSLKCNKIKQNDKVAIQINRDKEILRMKFWQHFTVKSCGKQCSS